MPLTDPGTISSALLVKVKANSSDGWFRLVTIYGPLIYEWCRRAHLQPADALDVSQDVLLSVVSAVRDFNREGPGTTFRGWLRQITRRKIIDHWRARSHRPAAAGGSSAQIVFEQVENAPWIAQLEADDLAGHPALVRRALELIRAEFSETTWTAFHLVCVEDQAPAEVAQQLGLTRNAVYLAKLRVLRRLRQELGDLDDDGSPGEVRADSTSAGAGHTVRVARGGPS